jgi:hypothetical protein
MKQRPASVTVFAIINLVLAGFVVFMIIIWLLSRMGLIPKQAEGNLILEAMESHAGYQLFSYVTTGLGVIATILILSASIGMFSLRPWARLATIGWGVYSILMTLIVQTVNYLVIFVPLLDDLSGAERVGLVFGMVLVAVIGFVYIGYYLLMIFMLTRPNVVQAFTPEPLEDCYDETGPPPAGLGGGDL